MHHSDTHLEKREVEWAGTSPICGKNKAPPFDLETPGAGELGGNSFEAFVLSSKLLRSQLYIIVRGEEAWPTALTPTHILLEIRIRLPSHVFKMTREPLVLGAEGLDVS